MPLNGQAYRFDQQTVQTVNEVGGVYGLARYEQNTYYILYVGESVNLRRRLTEHLNNPPARGITHFFAEVIPNQAQRLARETVLIQEFNPVGNTVGRD